MPMLDVSSALTSPYLMDVFDVIRRFETVGSNGRSVITNITFHTIGGVVYPEGDNRLRRDAERQTQGKGIMVVTRFALRGSSVDSTAQNYQPDFVVWHGNNFVLDEIKDYSAYGPGFVQAHGCMIDAVAQPPTEGAAMIVAAKIQQFPITIVSSTVLTVGVALGAGQYFLFRNGVLITVAAGDYTVSGSSTFNLTIPLQVGDTVAFYA